MVWGEPREQPAGWTWPAGGVVARAVRAVRSAARAVAAVRFADDDAERAVAGRQFW